ncbi:hypothetical protein PC116_g27480 [Phytophthora cactorum]|uniref:Uncharacterized protein n=1 Tax=Phytophthora cactorum TaxID=29920 RepID=A0A8T1AN65_9STRA|nr:hypothetical protein Pcac1_g26657 [Phytophthora cactorum]KAG2873494.1 hypothetical protein PC114_g25820 [Phytophthora cactorum]KAG2885170.1 hypothetical protein PC117_g25642 [Phytophthora cactorum]KAG2963908.1 hypothetical protein PC119_g25387 [Phytophthora cactorum]KAG4224064.1 hypothetical protein PC116_g27480 [Phytophthora cactorum]
MELDRLVTSGDLGKLIWRELQWVQGNVSKIGLERGKLRAGVDGGVNGKLSIGQVYILVVLHWTNEAPKILLKCPAHPLWLSITRARWATVMPSFVPIDLKTCCQKADTNFRSRSDTLRRRHNWQRLVNRSTTTQIESTSRLVRGRSVMKSIEMDLHRSSGILRGSIKPGGFVNRGLFRRHGSQSAMNFWIKLNILDQYQRRASVKYVLSAPGCPP